MSKLRSCAKASQENKKRAEYQTALYGKFSEFSIHETDQPIRVGIKFDNPIIFRMSAGKKYMTLPDVSPFTLLPGETMMVPSNMVMGIEFPEAETDNPTECICIEVEREKIDHIVAKLNENRSKLAGFGEWKFNSRRHSKFSNDAHVNFQMDRLMHIFMHEDNPYRDTLIDLNISQLIVRILQTNSRHLLIEGVGSCETDSGLAEAIRFIMENLGEKITMDQLSSLACMSQTTLYRHFKIEFGISPTQFIAQAKIKKACEMLRKPDRSVTSVCFELGFGNVSHFIKLFKTQIGETPKKYQQNTILLS